MAIANRPSVVREIGRDDAIRRLRQQVGEFERIYEVSSEEMLYLLQRGERSDTAEVAQWMVWYRTLKQLSR